MKMNEGDKISEKIEKQNLSVPNYGPQDQKMCKISAVHKTNDNTVLFWLQKFFCDTSSLYKFTDRIFVIEGFFLWNYGQKQNLPRFAQIFGPNFCHISKNISPIQKILLQ